MGMLRDLSNGYAVELQGVKSNGYVVIFHMVMQSITVLNFKWLCSGALNGVWFCLINHICINSQVIKPNSY